MFIRLLPILIRLIFIFERLVPFFILHFLERALRVLKTEGSINDYRIRIIRIRKFHYKIDIRLVLTAEQAKRILNNLVIRILNIRVK